MTAGPTVADAPPTDTAAHIEPEPEPKPSSLKRKSPPPSDTSPESPKRTRTDGPEHDSPTQPRDERRPSEDRPRPRSDDTSPKKSRRGSVHEARARVAQEEKRRGMRLFGGLLGTLNQRTGGSQQQQKRAEIEKRQQERLREQRAAEQKAAAEKRARLHEVRVRESIKWEEKALRVKHAALLDQAMFLRTKAHPPLLYKPWILTSAQKEQIQLQIRETEALVDTERQEFRLRKEAHTDKYGIRLEKPTTELTAAGGQSGEAKEHTPDHVKEVDNGENEGKRVERTEEEAQTSVVEDHHDESADVVVESAEDVVIY